MADIMRQKAEAVNEATFKQVRPLASCCCGFPLDAGVKLVLVFHSATSMFYMATTILNLVMDQPTLGHRLSPAMQCFNCGFAIATIPFIISGISGVSFKIEVHLRIYWLWLLICFVLDTVSVIIMLMQNSCVNLPKVMYTQGGTGGSFACGIMRMGSILLVVSSVVAMGYSLFAVWSYCEFLKNGGSVRSFESLGCKGIQGMRVPDAGLFGTGCGDVREAYPIVYGSLASPPIMGSVPIFDGKYHDCNYPPLY